MGRYGGFPPIGDVPFRPLWQTLPARSVTIEPKRRKRWSKAEKAQDLCHASRLASNLVGLVERGDPSDVCRRVGRDGSSARLYRGQWRPMRPASRIERWLRSNECTSRPPRPGNVEASPPDGCEPAMACKVVALSVRAAVGNGRIGQARMDQGAWLSWLERSLHTAEVGGSSPLAPTNFDKTIS
jgi:hypothetical protein